MASRILPSAADIRSLSEPHVVFSGQRRAGCGDHVPGQGTSRGLPENLCAHRSVRAGRNTGGRVCSHCSDVTMPRMRSRRNTSAFFFCPFLIAARVCAAVGSAAPLLFVVAAPQAHSTGLGRVLSVFLHLAHTLSARHVSFHLLLRSVMCTPPIFFLLAPSLPASSSCTSSSYLAFSTPPTATTTTT